MERKFWLRCILLGVFAIAILVVGGMGYLSSMKHSLWEQSVSNMLEVTVQGGKVFETYIDQGLTMLEGRANNFAQYDSTNAKSIGAKLDLYKDGDPDFAAIDLQRGIIYYNSKENSTITEEDLKKYLALPRYGMLEPFISEYSGHRVIAYYERFNFADGVPGIVRKSVLFTEMSQKFALSFYDGAGFSYIVNSSGDIMLRFGTENGNRTFLNLFDVVELDDDNTREDADAFHNAMLNKKRGVMQLNFGGKECIFAFVPLKGTESWYLVSTVPNDVIMEHANKMMKSSQLLVVVVTVALLVFTVFIMVAIRHRQQIQEKDTEVLYREQLFNLLSTTTDNVFLILNAERSRMVYVSPNMERVLGISHADLEADLSCIEDAVHGMEGKEESIFSLAVPLHDSVSFEGKCVHKVTKETRWFRETVYHAMIDKTERYIVLYGDRTEEREKEAVLTEALRIAKTANESKSTFLANMSHDIRTPMNAIVGLSTLLDRDADNPDKVREHTKKITSSSQHLLGLINDVLDMSKIETGKASLNVDDFNLAELLEDLDHIIRPQASAKKQTFEVTTLDIQNGNLVGDRQRISQVLVNILSNAVKYTPEGGRVTLVVKQLGQAAQNIVRTRFMVADNGIGMSEEYQGIIFQPFTREVRTTVNQIQGSGLGMAITKNLVELMGGTISLESKLGEGSTFTIDLDFCTRSVGQAEETASTETTGQSIAGLHFLAAEDNELNAEILVELLDMKGATCDVVQNGKEAVEKFAAEPSGTYDAILMDVQMPVMNGYEATRAIRALNHPQAAGIPITAMTANAFADDIRDAMAAGMNAHIAKPVDMEKLAETLNGLLGNAVPSAQ